MHWIRKREIASRRSCSKPHAAALLALDDRVAVSGQLQPGDMAEIAAAGFVAVVNNRPDGEAMFGQPRTADLRKAAEAAGLVFLDLPFSGPRATPDQVRAFADLLAGRPGRVVAFCKSGMRSALLWGAASIATRPVARRGAGRGACGPARTSSPVGEIDGGAAKSREGLSGGASAPTKVSACTPDAAAS